MAINTLPIIRDAADSVQLQSQRPLLPQPVDYKSTSSMGSDSAQTYDPETEASEKTACHVKLPCSGKGQKLQPIWIILQFHSIWGEEEVVLHHKTMIASKASIRTYCAGDSIPPKRLNRSSTIQVILIKSDHQDLIQNSNIAFSISFSIWIVTGFKWDAHGPYL